MTPPASRLPIAPVLAVTTSTQALTTLGALALAAVAPKAAAELGLSAALIGYQVAVVYAGAMAAAVFGGALARRLGATRLHQWGLWLVAAGCALSALGTLAAIALGAWVIGLGYGVTNPAASQLLARAPVARNMNLIFSLKQSSVPIGGILAGALVPPIALALGWQAALLAAASLMIAFSVAIGAVGRAWDADRDAQAPLLGAPLAAVALVWSHTILRWVALASFAYSAVQLCLTGFLVTYLVTELKLSLVLAGTLLSTTNAAGALGRLVWGWLADRLRSGSAALLVNGALAIVGALATAAAAAHWPVALVGAAAALFGFSAMGWNGVFIAVVARQSPPEKIASATGGALAVTYAGVLVGPSLFAVLHQHSGLSFGQSYGLLALVTAAGIACVAQARRASRR